MSLMDVTLASKLGIPIQPFSFHMNVRALDGRSICLKSALMGVIALDLSAIPTGYQDLREEARATSLPQNRLVPKDVKPDVLACCYSPTATPLEAKPFPPAPRSLAPLLFILCCPIPSVYFLIVKCLDVNPCLTALCLLFPGPPSPPSHRQPTG
jgi:hypothetical protein